MKIWAYKYRTTRSVLTLDTPEGAVEGITASGHPGWTAPIEYSEVETCWIYSDAEVPGLTLVDSDVAFGEGAE